jgi:predicted ATP-dependent protease
VVYEDKRSAESTSYANLIGSHRAHRPDGRAGHRLHLIKAGALHRANGGYLILDARAPADPAVRLGGAEAGAPVSRQVRIESLGQALSLITTVTLEPEPIPLDVKVVLTGERLLYYLLYNLRPRVPELFKVKADFAVDRGRTTSWALRALVAPWCREEGLRHFDRSAVARLCRARGPRAADREKLSTRFASSLDLVRESDYWAAGRNGAEWSPPTTSSGPSTRRSPRRPDRGAPPRDDPAGPS